MSNFEFSNVPAGGLALWDAKTLVALFTNMD